MFHVGRRVGELRRGQWPVQPVGELVPLGQTDAEDEVDQAAQRRRGHAEDPAANLGVEHGPGGRPQAVRRMSRSCRRRGRRRCPVLRTGAGAVQGRRPADRPAPPGPAHPTSMGEPGPVGALGVEFGVERVELLAGDVVAERVETVGLGDQVGHVDIRTHHADGSAAGTRPDPPARGIRRPPARRPAARPPRPRSRRRGRGQHLVDVAGQMERHLVAHRLGHVLEVRPVADGSTTVVSPARWAASTFCSTPPMGSTRPWSVTSPVIPTRRGPARPAAG